MKNNNVFQEILKKGYDDDFIPQECEEPTNAMPGSFEKVEVMRMRLEQGVELFCSRDICGVATIEQSKHMQEVVANLGRKKRDAARQEYLQELASGKSDKRYSKTKYLDPSRDALKRIIEGTGQSNARQTDRIT